MVSRSRQIGRLFAAIGLLTALAAAPVVAGDDKMDRLLTQGGCCYSPPPYFDCTYDYPKRATELARDRLTRPADKVCWGEMPGWGGRHEWWGACKTETDTAYVVEVWWLPGQPGYQFGEWASDGSFDYRGLHIERPCPRNSDGDLIHS